MTNFQARTSSKSKSTAATRATKVATPRSPDKAQPKSTTTSKADSLQQEARVTKHQRVLALLSKPEGATIENMMEVTDWQQHSVRGFLSGTVKTKLGLDLTSSKIDGEARRYRIVTRRSR
jgi:hypothetical protein